MSRRWPIGLDTGGQDLRSHRFLSLEESVENRRWHAHPVVRLIALL
jgi:hypothetical protein